MFITSPAERAAYTGTVLGRVLAPGEPVGRRAALLLEHGNRLYGDAGRPRLFGLSYFDIAAPSASWIARLVTQAPDVESGRRACCSPSPSTSPSRRARCARESS